MSSVDWYASEPRLAFNRIVGIALSSHLDPVNSPPAPSTCVLAPVRRLAYEAATAVSSAPIWPLAFAVLKELKKLGMRLGNWLTARARPRAVARTDSHRLKGKTRTEPCSHCYSRVGWRHEAVGLTLDHLQQREEHWAIVDLVGKGGQFERFRFPIGMRPNWTIGSPQPQ